MAEEPPSTRDRVLSACRGLFNERGPASATTAEIAARVGINEGNLYYYFKRKEQILITLFDEFEQAMDRVARRGLEEPAEPSRYSDYLTGWFRLMWEYRFFYRDGAALFKMAPSLRARVKVLTDRGQQNVRRVLMDMAAHGMLRAGPKEIDQLVINSWIIATYWLEYLRSREGVNEITVTEVEWGFNQVKSLFAPYLATPQRPRSLYPRLSPVIAGTDAGETAEESGEVLTRGKAERQRDIGNR
jgi:AcrR family transcriptional regulator